jgi:hypothetical protein
MGALDEAIREHLELKRKLGTSEEELERKENEAFGRGAAGVAAASTPPAQVAEPGPEAETPAEPEPEAAPGTVIMPEPPPSAGIVDEEMEPDEVLPEESLETEPAKPSVARITDPDVEELEPEAPAEIEEWDDVDPSEDVPPGEDPLEGTPEFLEESPDQERLWFEQKPPKDFDFDD